MINRFMKIIVIKMLYFLPIREKSDSLPISLYQGLLISTVNGPVMSFLRPPLSLPVILSFSLPITELRATHRGFAPGLE